MSQRRADKRAVDSHFRDSGADIITMLASIMCDPRRENFLQSGQSTRRQHLGTKGVGLKLDEICLKQFVSSASTRTLCESTPTARYPLAFSPPMSLSPTPWAKACFRPPGMGASLMVSFSNLTDMICLGELDRCYISQRQSISTTEYA